MTREFKEATTEVMSATDVIGRGTDFLNVTSVIQVDLPMNGEQYVHRVGRTARVDRDARGLYSAYPGLIVLLAVHQNLPIQPYVHSTDMTNHAAAPEGPWPTSTKKTTQEAYSAYLGFMNKPRVSPEGRVAMANELAVEALGCPGPPPLEKKTVGKNGP